MKVLLDHSAAAGLAERFPGKIGAFMGPSRQRRTSLPYALDNGRFICWSKGTEWDEAAFWSMLLRFDEPEWVVVPDVVGDAAGTFEEWDKWRDQIDPTRTTKLALAVQDGMTPESVRKYTDPDVIFVGGTTQWKRQTLWKWCNEFPRVHVGRVNYEKWLWHAARCEAESCDGTGWFRGDKNQERGLVRFLEADGNHPQLELGFARFFNADPKDA